jgi:hypothetical protein
MTRYFSSCVNLCNKASRYVDIDKIQRSKELTYDYSDSYLKNKGHELDCVYYSDINAISNISKKDYLYIRSNIYGLDGYTLYNETKIFCSSDSLIDSKADILVKLEAFIACIADETILKALVVGMTDRGDICTSFKSFYITKHTSPEFLFSVYSTHIVYLEKKYYGEDFNH